ncbi:MAG: APC family permease [Coxiellaceae bacterium]|nr:APC family permease [Coxiellaceae bacterium]
MMQTLSLFSLMMLITGAIDSIRNLPATALFGSTLIFFFIFAAILFLIPVALISAELSSKWTHKGGVYFWVTKALGEKVGFLAIWLQWINTMVWYPTMLSFIAGILAYIIDPALAQNKYYLISVILIVFWALTALNLRGLRTSARFAAACTVIGMVIPMILIVVLAAIWIVKGEPMQIHLTASNIFPSLAHPQNWISLTAIVASYLGMELATVHVSHVKDPSRNFPKALMCSVAIILITMILGSLAIAMVLPHDKISLVTGVMEVFNSFFHSYHMQWFVPIIAIMILIGSFGGMINWIISPARGLLQAADHHFLPHFLQYRNKHDVAAAVLLLQAILVSVICLVFLFVPSVNGSYWFLTDLSTELYLLMYLLMFIAAIVLKKRFPRVEGAFHLPGKQWCFYLVCVLGMMGCGLALYVGFFPPAGIDVGGDHHYRVMFTCGLLAMICPVVIFYIYHLWKIRCDSK